MLYSFLLVALGGAVGSAARYGISLLIPTPSAGFPWATFFVNIVGAFVIGALAGVAGRGGGWMLNAGWPLLATGICGGFTTFSAASLEGLRMLQSGATGMALLYLVGSVVFGLALCALGFRLTA